MVRLNQNRSKLLLGCGSAALAMGLAMAPQIASAQAIQATETVTTGGATRIFTGSGTEDIRVSSTVAVIDWVPDEDGLGNALDFLPTGNVVTFRNDVNNSDFAVLNRILPSANGNVTVIDGTVLSRLFDISTGAPLGAGGTVAFYSPTGLFIGSNAVFDVGNLILTTLDPDQASFADFAVNGGQLQMFGQTGTTASIIISPGAQILASPENSYFAVTAAEIQMFGTSSVNGSTAFVAGEQVNLTVSNGLFDIQIPVGTSVLTPIVVDGDVGGPSSTGVTDDNHLIYAVARAQNDPISMIFRGNLGFEPAASAGIVNGEIILSANYEVSGRDAAGQNIQDDSFSSFVGNLELTDVAGSIFMEDFTSTSSIMAVANEEVQVTAFNGPSSIDGNLLMFGRNFSELTASNSQTFDIFGNVIVSADDIGAFDPDPIPGSIDAVAGQAFIDAFDNGTLNIFGNALVTADATAGVDLSLLQSGSATGGFATIASNGGTLNITGSGTASADAIFDVENGGIVLGGNVFTAGTAQVFAALGGQVTIDGAVLATASANGAFGDDLNPSTGSIALGGLAIVQTLNDGSSLTMGDGLIIAASAAGGRSNETAPGGLADAGQAFLFTYDNTTIDVTGDVNILAQGFGGENASGQGGDGLGGNAQVFLNSGGLITINGNVTTDAQGFGGDGTNGGNGSGGITGAGSNFGTLNITGNVNAISEGFGGDALFGFGGLGGIGMGGNSFVQANGTLIEVATVTIGGDVNINSNGRGGMGGQGDGSVLNAGTGGEGIGGQIGTPNQANTNFGSGAYLLAGGDNGNLTVAGTSTVTAFGIGGQGGDGGLGQNGGDGGNGTGGTAQAGSALLGLDGSVGAGTVTLGDVTVFANGDGGIGGNGTGTGTIQGNGGDGTGFGAFFTARAGTVSAGNVFINAEGIGGFGHVGGIGTGGLASIQGSLGATATIGGLNASALGTGGDGDNQGGDGNGGEVTLGNSGYDITVNGNLLFNASGSGGFTSIGRGGSATGGLAQAFISTDESSITVTGNTELRAAADAADSNTVGQGASAIGGQALVSITSNDSIMAVGGTLTLEASAFGGANFGTGTGGDGIGGRRAFVFVDNGGALSVGSSFTAAAQGQGGDGSGGGGNGFGGVAGAQVRAGSIDFGLSVLAQASGLGGNASGSPLGGLGGYGQGGRALVAADGTLTETGSISIFGDAIVAANGSGGTGGNGDGSIIGAGIGGNGQAGRLDLLVVADNNEASGAFLVAGGDNGALSVGGASQVQAIGTGGMGGAGGSGLQTQDGGRGGDGFGGDAQAGTGFFGLTDGSVGNGTATFGNVIVAANGQGGFGGAAGGLGAQQGDGGDGEGLRALVNASAGGTLTATNVTAFSRGRGGDGANGGNGTGGIRAGLFGNTSGAFTVGSFVGDAQGFGGQGTVLAGGDGQGGQAFIGFQDVTGVVNGDVTVDATGTGGNSAGGDGGDGTGGVADIAIFTAIAGNGTVTGHSAVRANGIGGEASSGSTGGTGTGGLSFVQTQAGGTITFNTLQVVASGQGGSGPSSNGGAGVGGLAEIRSFDSGSQLTVQNENTVVGGPLTQGTSILAANGIGGSTTGGTGIGGTGTGGAATLFARNLGSVTLANGAANTALGNRITARGVGGASSVDLGTGGAASGGFAIIEVDSGTVVAGRTLLSSFAQGGGSGNSGLNVSGGDGSGGDRLVSVSNDGTLSVELFGGVSGGVGGSGSGSGDGGDGSGGTSSLNVSSGTVNFIGRSIVVNQNQGGDGSTGGDATGGAVDVVISGGVINILPNANGEAELVIGGTALGGFGTAGGGNAFAADTNVLFSEATVSGGALTVDASGRGGASDDQGGNGTGGEVFVVGTDSIIALDGEFLIAAEGFGGGGAIGGDAFGGFASLDLLGTDLTMSPDANGDARILIETSGNAGLGSNLTGDAVAGYSQLLLFNSTVTATELFLAAEAEASGAAFDALGGDAVAGLVEAIIEGNTTVNVGAFGMVAPALSSAEGTATAGEVELSIGGPSGAPDVSAGQVFLNADADGGGDDSGPANVSGIFTVDISSGQLVTDAFTASAVGDGGPSAFGASSITAVGGSLLTAETLTATVDEDLLIETGLGGIIGGPTIADPTAGLSLTSGGSVVFSGDDDNAITIGGATMNVTSHDIVINNGARLGAFTMVFTSTNTDAPAVLGGSGTPQGGVTGEGYSFIAEELGRLDVGNFTFRQPEVGEQSGNDPDLIIRDITASGSLDDGVGSILVAVDGPNGIVRVEGQLIYEDAGSSDSLSLFADNRIEVVTPGGIAIVDQSGNPAGTMFLGAGSIWVADSDLIALLQDNPTFTGRNDQLAVATSGSDDPLGYLRAGGVSLDVGQQLLVRNTGTTSAQGGILVGDGGLSIFGADNSESSLDVFAYGARQEAGGTLVTGIEFYNEVNFNNANASGGSTLYTDESEFNDCLINSGECDDVITEGPTNEETSDPVIVTINNPAVVEAAISTMQPVETSEAESDDDFGIDFPEFVEAEDIEDEEDIEDPVASGGDSSLYGKGGNVVVEGN